MNRRNPQPGALEYKLSYVTSPIRRIDRRYHICYLLNRYLQT